MNAKQLKLVMDIDGTLCPVRQKNETYEELIPYSHMVEQLKQYKQEGAYIVLYTSRNVNSYDGNIGLINANTAKVMLQWLDKWEIPYDEIIYGKPWPGHHGFYVDDRAIRPDEFIDYSIDEIDQLLKNANERFKEKENK